MFSEMSKQAPVTALNVRPVINPPIMSCGRNVTLTGFPLAATATLLDVARRFFVDQPTDLL